MMKLVLALLMFPVASLAGDSGCGLGSMIIKSNTKLLQLFSMTTNGSSFSQPLGITSGTSGCTASGLVKNDKQIQYFVEVNSEELKRQMAVGNGEKLSTLATLNGCIDSNSQRVFAEWTKENYQTLVPSSDVSWEQLNSNLKNATESSKVIQQSCDITKVSSI
jgi:hypothetical protein